MKVTEDNIDYVLLADEFRGKEWTIVTGHGVFKSNRLSERWIVPVPMDPCGFGDRNPRWHEPNWLAGTEPVLERVFRLDRIRVEDFTAFYEYETTRRIG